MFEKAVGIDDSNAQAQTGLWASALATGREQIIDDAFRDRARQAAQADPDHMTTALLLAVEGDDAGALDALAEAVRIAPGEADHARFRPEFEGLLGHPRFLEITQ